MRRWVARTRPSRSLPLPIPWRRDRLAPSWYGQTRGWGRTALARRLLGEGKVNSQKLGPLGDPGFVPSSSSGPGGGGSPLYDVHTLYTRPLVPGGCQERGSTCLGGRSARVCRRCGWPVVGRGLWTWQRQRRLFVDRGYVLMSVSGSGSNSNSDSSDKIPTQAPMV